MDTEAPLPPEAGPESAPPGAGRQFAFWVVAALAAVALLVLVLRREQRHVPARFAALAGDARKGEALFREKGCMHCHSVHGAGGKLGPDLSGKNLAGPDRLLAAMWNHAPQMLEQAQSEKVELPSLTHEEVAHVTAYLSAAGRPR